MQETIEAKNEFKNYLYYVKQQVTDEEKLGGKIGENDKQVILHAFGEASEWLDSNVATATKEDINEQKHELEVVVNSISSKLYDSAAGGDGEYVLDHDEL
ncbi:ATPase with role in protein import into the ER [Physocladia obscura]|uniref:ATPase with role in protein import into the ER n=1 Tax=Physocladia obscura TaxID=109957 RepID=A0AAD5X6N6_9FUNG|nr:ATPase with role in protein import into the ER [Physocladia obscura]